MSKKLAASYKYVPVDPSQNCRVYEAKTKLGAWIKALWDLRFAWEYYNFWFIN